MTPINVHITQSTVNCYVCWTCVGLRHVRASGDVDRAPGGVDRASLSRLTLKLLLCDSWQVLHEALQVGHLCCQLFRAVRLLQSKTNLSATYRQWSQSVASADKSICCVSSQQTKNQYVMSADKSICSVSSQQTSKPVAATTAFNGKNILAKWALYHRFEFDYKVSAMHTALQKINEILSQTFD